MAKLAVVTQNRDRLGREERLRSQIPQPRGELERDAFDPAEDHQLLDRERAACFRRGLQFPQQLANLERVSAGRAVNSRAHRIVASASQSRADDGRDRSLTQQPGTHRRVGG